MALPVPKKSPLMSRCRRARLRKDVYYAREIARNHPGADRQLAAYEQRHDIQDVVDYIISETEHGI
jgi:hypothetical protein